MDELAKLLSFNNKTNAARDLEIHNASSEYYNNKATSKSRTDINLNDRRNEFVENNMTLCEEDFNLVDYNYINKKAKCSCLVKISIPLFDEIKFDKTRLYDSFTDVKISLIY